MRHGTQWERLSIRGSLLLYTNSWLYTYLAYETAENEDFVRHMGLKKHLSGIRSHLKIKIRPLYMF